MSGRFSIRNLLDSSGRSTCARSTDPSSSPDVYGTLIDHENDSVMTNHKSVSDSQVSEHENRQLVGVMSSDDPHLESVRKENRTFEENRTRGIEPIWPMLYSFEDSQHNHPAYTFLRNLAVHLYQEQDQNQNGPLNLSRPGDGKDAPGLNGVTFVKPAGIRPVKCVDSLQGMKSLRVPTTVCGRFEETTFPDLGKFWSRPSANEFRNTMNALEIGLVYDHILSKRFP